VSLKRLYNRFLKETASIDLSFDAPYPNVRPFDQSCKMPHKYSHEMCVVRLHDAWARFCRELIFLCAACEPTTISGVVVARAPGVSDRSDVLPALLASYPAGKPPWWEPRWGDPGECLDAAQRLNVSNYSRLSSGLSISPSPVDDLRFIRNFFAHRSEKAARKVHPIATSYGFARLTPALTIVETVIPPGVPIFKKWINDLDIMASQACT